MHPVIIGTIAILLRSALRESESLKQVEKFMLNKLSIRMGSDKLFPFIFVLHFFSGFWVGIQ